MLSRSVATLALWLMGCAFAGSAHAFFHSFRINEIFSNSNGSIQFIELLNGNVNGEMFSGGVVLAIARAGGGASHNFIFPSNLPSSATALKSVLIATQGFANLGIVAPDFIMPDGFVFTGGGAINLGNFDVVTYAALPTDGVTSVNRLGTTGVNSPRNFAGASGSVVFNVIDHYYQNILGRAGDAPGIAFWQSEAARLGGLGADPTEAYIAMAVAFYTSPEFAARGLGDTGFVDSLYGTFFNRPADSGGRNYWVGQIQLGLSREMVMYGFLFSGEFATFMAQNVGSTPSRPEVYTVIDFYRGAFARLPDSSGLAFWVNRFRVAQCTGNPTGPVYEAVLDIAGGFFASVEYATALPPRTNDNHIGNLYNAFMRRGADVAGYQFWVNQLAGGSDLNTVRKTGFIDSPEFANRVQQIVAAGCTGLMP